MKNITVLALSLFLAISSCSKNEDEETTVVIEDKSKAPNELKGIWKVDFYAYAADPNFIGANNIGCSLSFSDTNLISFKDIYSVIINKSAKYTVSSAGFIINLDDIEINTRPSTAKIGYTEFYITYRDLPSRNCILFAKKQ